MHPSLEQRRSLVANASAGVARTAVGFVPHSGHGSSSNLWCTQTSTSITPAGETRALFAAHSIGVTVEAMRVGPRRVETTFRDVVAIKVGGIPWNAGPLIIGVAFGAD
jgi:hypothetical protein